MNIVATPSYRNPQWQSQLYLLAPAWLRKEPLNLVPVHSFSKRKEHILASHCIPCQKGLSQKICCVPPWVDCWVLQFTEVWMYTQVHCREYWRDSMNKWYDLSLPCFAFDNPLSSLCGCHFDSHYRYHCQTNYHTKDCSFLFYVSEGVLRFWGTSVKTITRPSFADFLSCIPTRLIVEYYYIIPFMNILLFVSSSDITFSTGILLLLLFLVVA